MLGDARQTLDSSEQQLAGLVVAGTIVVGEYHCAGCGYGVTVHAALPACPMCQGETWEPVAWSPFMRPPQPPLQ